MICLRITVLLGAYFSRMDGRLRTFSRLSIVCSLDPLLLLRWRHRRDSDESSPSLFSLISGSFLSYCTYVNNPLIYILQYIPIFFLFPHFLGHLSLPPSAIRVLKGLTFNWMWMFAVEKIIFSPASRLKSGADVKIIYMTFICDCITSGKSACYSLSKLWSVQPSLYAFKNDSIQTQCRHAGSLNNRRPDREALITGCLIQINKLAF